MAEFVVGGIAYKSKMMDGEMQTLVLKRLLPTFTALVGAAPSLRGQAAPEEAAAPTEADPGEETPAPAASTHDLLMPVARELAAVADADVQFVLNACLQVTQRQLSTGKGWAPVVQRGLVQDDADAKFVTRLTVAWHVLAENFGEMLGSFGLDLAAIERAAPRARA